ncbi:hypothetical protein [Candidatus Mycoplasma haematominutum]|uniref:Uncharacterized protein n=1 Tax=Candidatus Mycoplasma haematominutum 'Birmingham 1' TaxID=1116213 RepID=G8C3Y5_9MOLU|nr:hypothetical protein [Candidatus Mycoplasma haematominutum]CCE67033.1 hypothetical protein (homolog to MSU_0838) [Candidatus Mycoplasma haematominutum 'Birmingham 1']
MIKLFLDSAIFIKVFGASFTALAAMTTGAFYYVGSKTSRQYEEAMSELDKKKEIVLAKQRQVEKLRMITIP